MEPDPLLAALTCRGCGAPAEHRTPSGRALCGPCMALGGGDSKAPPGGRGRSRFDPSKPHHLVPLPVVCPWCKAPTRRDVSRQDALFFHGGFGATVRTEREACTACWWASDPWTIEERPPRKGD